MNKTNIIDFKRNIANAGLQGPYDKNGKTLQRVGLVLLAIGTAAGVHSANMPSHFTAFSFARDKEKKEYLEKTLNETLVLGGIISLGMGLVFKDWLVGVASLGGFVYFNVRSRMALNDGRNATGDAWELPKDNIYKASNVKGIISKRLS